jgi:ABC-2 type transport system ATP-binding protein
VAEDVGGVLSGISKRFSRRGQWVLNGIDLEILPASQTVIVGGNGSGKSTLLRIVARLTQPTMGRVVTPTPIGYVPERLAGGSRLTGAEYIAHMGRIKGLDAKTIDVRSRELFERLDLQPGPNVPSGVLSKGNRQKLVVAQAFLGPVGLLVLDEPYSGLDAAAHRSLSELIEEATDRGTSVLVSAHRAEAIPGADRLFHIGDGAVREMPGLRSSPPAPSGINWHIELVARPNACPLAQIEGLVGVRSIEHDTFGTVLSLVVDKAHADEILTTAIALGWSVATVGQCQENEKPT